MHARTRTDTHTDARADWGTPEQSKADQHSTGQASTGQASTGQTRTGAAIAPERVLDHIRLDGVSRLFGERRVLTDITFSVSRGARLGLIGENGAGKSTLLRITAGADGPDAGTVSRPERTGLLRQEVPHDDDDTVEDLVERSLVDVRSAERELTDAAEALDGSDAASERYAAALDRAERLNVWDADARRDRVLAGLGLSGIPLSRRLDSVSGGQRSRFALAALLLERSDALLLDEPTNHLDDDAVAFLRAELSDWSGPVLFASHDRAFLDEVATGLIDLDASRHVAGEAADAPAAPAAAGEETAPSGVTVFGGSFTEYRVERARERERWERQYANEQEELARLARAVDVTARAVGHDRARRDNNKAAFDLHGERPVRQVSRRVRNARSRLEQLRASQVARPPEPLSFAGIPADAHPRGDREDLLVARDVLVRGRLAALNVSIGPLARLLVTGPNGAGKSTLLQVLEGTLSPEHGAVSRRRGLRTRMLEQDVRFARPERSARDLYENAAGRDRAERMPLTSLGLLAPRDVDRSVGALSVGQQRRLALALLVARPPHLFLLDEPTNHLSLSLVTELEEALGSFPGAVVVATHDRWLRRRWEGKHLALLPAS